MATDTNSISNSVLEKLGVKSETKTASKTLSQDTFLKLMVAQMNNQDPNKPMDSSNMLTQLSQFGQLNGITQMQKSLDTLTSTLASAMQSNQALQASTMVGRTVSVEAGKLTTMAAGQSVTGSLNLPSASGGVSLKVFNAAGSLVKEISLGAQPAGDVQFTWEGMDAGGSASPAGTYTIKAEALMNGTTVAVKTNLDAKVESVSLGTGGVGSRLNLAGLGSVGIDSVKAIR
jgi:flagellar basal-body rod modification protein FlgD